LGRIIYVRCPKCRMRKRMWYGAGMNGCADFVYCSDCRRIRYSRWRSRVDVEEVASPLEPLICTEDPTHRVLLFELNMKQVKDGHGWTRYKFDATPCPKCGRGALEIEDGGVWD
jgi:ssDNA-binding Zn-finger/Zn-ribbon topoisomerase 1